MRPAEKTHESTEMTKQQLILTPIYAALWVFMAWALYSDLFVWRKDPPASGAQIQAAQQAERFKVSRK